MIMLVGLSRINTLTERVNALTN